MEIRDRLASLGLLSAAFVCWGLVGILVVTRDPIADLRSGLLGAGLMGLATAISTIPLAWLVVFARNRRINYRGDWFRAVRRGTWVGLIVAFLVALRVQGTPSLPILLFVIVIVLVAEVTLSVER